MSASSIERELVTFTIDGSAIKVPKGTTVYQAAKEVGIEIPIFCYQDRMPPFGACRMCLVEVEKMGKLQASCTLQATEGMVVKTKSDLAIKEREQILELLLINHPLDCPICDRGGECPLQDQTYQHGPDRSRFYEEKRHFVKPIPLGPVLMLDRERCITCARCTRFGSELAGDHALEFIDRGFRTEVGTPGGGPVKSKFIGNTIMLCPVGALTSQVYRFRARPWDNDVSPTTCTLCPVGCSMLLDSRDGELLRTRVQENRSVNDIWLCDKGWFGYEFCENKSRLQKPLVKKNGKFEEVSWDEALNVVASKMLQHKDKGKAAAIGGRTLTVEECFLFQKLMREGLNSSHVDYRPGLPLFSIEEEGLLTGMEQTIGECEELKEVYLLGCDLTEEFPVIWLRLRQAINKGAKVFFLGHFAPEIASYLSHVALHRPGDELREIDRLFGEHPPKTGSAALFVGSQYLANPKRKEILQKLMRLKESHGLIAVNLLEGRGNAMGARLAGMHPEMSPLGKRRDKAGLHFLDVFSAAKEKGWNFLYVAGANPAKMLAAEDWSLVRRNTDFLVVQDLFMTKTAESADVVLPALAFVEKEGSFVNIERRVQKLNPGKALPCSIYSDGEIFALLALKLNFILTIDEEFAECLEADRRLSPDLFGWSERKSDIPQGKVDVKEGDAGQEMEGVLVSFSRPLFDQGVRMQHNSHLRDVVKKQAARLNSDTAKRFGLKDGDRIRIEATKDEGSFAARSCAMDLAIDRDVAKDTVVLPFGYGEEGAETLAPDGINGFIALIVKEEAMISVRGEEDASDNP